MKNLIFILISILIVSLQIVFVSRLTFFGGAPNLVLVFILILAVCRREQTRNWLILIPALLLDILVGQPFGFFSLSVWATFFLVGWLAKAVFKPSGFFSILALITSGVVFFEFIFRFLLKGAAIFHSGGGFSFSAFYFFSVLPVSMVANIALGLAVFLIFRKFKNKQALNIL